MTEYKKELDSLRILIPFWANEIVEKQYELEPAFLKFGNKGKLHSIEDAKINLEYLFASIEVESMDLFIEYNIWVANLFRNLNLPTRTLKDFYLCLLDLLERERPTLNITNDLYFTLKSFIDIAINKSLNGIDKKKTQITLDNPFGKIFEAYSEAVFSNDRSRITEIIREALINEIEIKDIYKYILQPFQIRLGDLWHENKISVAEEHYATALSQYAMTLLYEKIFSVPKNGKTLLGTCVTGELHEFGIRMICDYFESCGWNTIYLGSNLPEKSIVSIIKEKNPDVIAISCTMTFNISKLSGLVYAIREAGIMNPIIVGGYPFVLDRDLSKKVGANNYTIDFEGAYNLAEEYMKEVK